MRNLRKTFLVSPLLLLLLLAVVFAQQMKERATAQRGLGIEIALSKSFYVPAANAGQKLAAFIRVPAKADNTSQAEQISAIKVAPEMVGDKVKVTVSSISGDTSGIKTCSDWSALKEMPVASYTLNEGEEVTVTQFANLGSNFKDGMLVFKAVPLRAAPQQAPKSPPGGCGCGWCGGLSCCPNPGYCLTCAPCGDVCCAPSGGGGN
jgi:hypothetical protein